MRRPAFTQLKLGVNLRLRLKPRCVHPRSSLIFSCTGYGSARRVGRKPSKAPAKSSILCLCYTNRPSYYRPSVVDNAQLTHKGTGECRLGIYEPDDRRTTRMRL